MWNITNCSITRPFSAQVYKVWKVLVSVNHFKGFPLILHFLNGNFAEGNVI